MSKRWRTPTTKPGQLKVCYGKLKHDIPDLLYCHGGDGVHGCDARLLAHFFENVVYFEDRNLRQELELRGYDITTFRMTIEKKANK